MIKLNTVADLFKAQDDSKKVQKKCLTEKSVGGKILKLSLLTTKVESETESRKKERRRNGH